MQLLPKEVGHTFCRDRFAKEEPLHFVTSVISQERLLFGRLHALRYDRHPQGLPHADDRLRDRLVFGIPWDIPNKGTVYLNRIDRKLLHKRHRRIAGAEIVEGDTNSSTALAASLATTVYLLSDRWLRERRLRVS
ncbi:hypothetical protein LJR220_000655 [Bradyrhizobium sp. LjRoot220]